MKYLMKSKLFTESKKYIKTYDNVNEQDPKIGDYVVCDEVFNNLKDFISSNIGQIVFIDYKDSSPYVVKYDNVPENLYSFFYYDLDRRDMMRDEILFFSSDKQDCEDYLISKKYNL